MWGQVPADLSSHWRPWVDPALPAVFTGGWVGYCGYETVRYGYLGTAAHLVHLMYIPRGQYIQIHMLPCLGWFFGGFAKGTGFLFNTVIWKAVVSWSLTWLPSSKLGNDSTSRLCENSALAS